MEDRRDATDAPLGLSDTLADEVVTYRPVNTLAVLGLVLALVSALALVTRWFVFAPVAAAIVSWVAARKVRADPEASSGFGLAAAGLAISLVVLGAVAIQKPVAQRLHTDSANVVADEFLKRLAAGDLAGAYELTLPFSERRPSPELVAVYYESDSDARQRLAEFGEKEAVLRLAGAGVPEFVERTEIGPPRQGRLSSYWIYRASAEGSQAEVGVSLKLDRPASKRFGPLAWRLADVGLTSADR